MQEILDNIVAGIKAGLEKARKANTVEPLVGFDIGDIIELDDGRLAIAVAIHEDNQILYVRPWDALGELEIPFAAIDTNAHWKKPNDKHDGRL